VPEVTKAAKAYLFRPCSMLRCDQTAKHGAAPGGDPVSARWMTRQIIPANKQSAGRKNLSMRLAVDD